MTTRGRASIFVVGQTYENRRGYFTVLGIRGNSLEVRYEDGATATLDAGIQEQIVDNVRREREVQAETLRRTRPRPQAFRLPSPPPLPKPAPRRELTAEQRRLERLERLDQFLISQHWPKVARERVRGLLDTGYLRIITGPFGGFGLMLGAEPAESVSVAAAQQQWLFEAFRGTPPPSALALLSLAPMPPDEGPPLPRRLNRRWAPSGAMRLRF